jgi:hypothetical protein
VTSQTLWKCTLTNVEGLCVYTFEIFFFFFLSGSLFTYLRNISRRIATSECLPKLLRYVNTLVRLCNMEMRNITVAHTGTVSPLCQKYAFFVVTFWRTVVRWTNSDKSGCLVTTFWQRCPLLQSFGKNAPLVTKLWQLSPFSQNSEIHVFCRRVLANVYS